MGLLTKLGAPDWHPAPREVHVAGRQIAEPSKIRGASISSTAIRFCLDHGYASSTLVGMSTRAEVK
jgi:L-galactose dehydrogenase